eukprot:5334056-Prymnesium_polylepis.2
MSTANRDSAEEALALARSLVTRDPARAVKLFEKAMRMCDELSVNEELEAARAAAARAPSEDQTESPTSAAPSAASATQCDADSNAVVERILALTPSGSYCAPFFLELLAASAQVPPSVCANSRRRR